MTSFFHVRVMSYITYFSWDLMALNDEIHQLGPVFPVRYETVQGQY